MKIPRSIFDTPSPLNPHRAPLSSSWIGECHAYAVGFRLWRLRWDNQTSGVPLLRSLTRDYVWASGEHTVDCVSRPESDDAASRLPIAKTLGEVCFREPLGSAANQRSEGMPSERSLSRCRCGFHAFYSLENLLGDAGIHQEPLGHTVAGIVRVRGHTVAGDLGMRADRAQIAALLDTEAVERTVRGMRGSGVARIMSVMFPIKPPGAAPSMELFPPDKVLRALADSYEVPLLGPEEVEPFLSLAGKRINVSVYGDRDSGT